MSRRSLILAGCLCAGLSAGCLVIVASVRDIPLASAAFGGVVLFGALAGACFSQSADAD
jgi:glutamate synthase domain-containing protein 3